MNNIYTVIQSEVIKFIYGVFSKKIDCDGSKVEYISTKTRKKDNKDIDYNLKIIRIDEMIQKYNLNFKNNYIELPKTLCRTLEVLLKELASQNKNEISININDFLIMMDLSYQNKTRKNIIRNIEILSNVRLDYTLKIKGKDKIFRNVKIIENFENHNGKLTIKFSNNFLESVRFRTHYMKSIILTYENPITFRLAWLIFYNKSVNKDETRKNKLSIEDIYSFVGLAQYENLDKKRVKQQIFKPLEKSLNQLQNDKIIKEWYYSYKGEKKEPPQTFWEWRNATINFIFYTIYK